MIVTAVGRLVDSDIVKDPFTVGKEGEVREGGGGAGSQGCHTCAEPEPYCSVTQL